MCEVAWPCVPVPHTPHYTKEDFITPSTFSAHNTRISPIQTCTYWFQGTLCWVEYKTSTPNMSVYIDNHDIYATSMKEEESEHVGSRWLMQVTFLVDGTVMHCMMYYETLSIGAQTWFGKKSDSPPLFIGKGRCLNAFYITGIYNQWIMQMSSQTLNTSYSCLSSTEAPCMRVIAGSGCHTQHHK